MAGNPRDLDFGEPEREGWPEVLERRTARRQPCGLPVQVHWRGKQMPGALGDLSRSGMSLSTEAALPPGEQIRVVLEGNSTMVWRCSVVHRRPASRSLTGLGHGSVGLELRELSPTLELLLRN
ncbi:MAG: PilZ domain-containing protein [bacterium]|nr:PilZ domain-containing protein [bacterium]